MSSTLRSRSAELSFSPRMMWSLTVRIAERGEAFGDAEGVQRGSLHLDGQDALRA